MNPKRLFMVTVFAIAAFLLVSSARCEASEITTKFIEAFDTNDYDGMTTIVETNKARIPDEVKSIIEEAQNASNQDEKESHFYMAEMMAKMYMESTGDTAPLLDVKRKSFDAKLTASARPEPVDGVYIIEIPKATEGVKNVFRPNSMVIKKGSTVRWVNKDEIAHVFASMPVIGKGGLSAPMIEPGGSWEYKFDKPGEYFYICFIHHAMIGKITVEE